MSNVGIETWQDQSRRRRHERESFHPEDTAHRPRAAERWLLVFLVVGSGMVGGLVGGIVGPVPLDGLRVLSTLPGFLLCSGLGAAVGVLPSLLAGLVTYFVSRPQSSGGMALIASVLLALFIFVVNAALAGGTLFFLVLAGMSAC